MSRLQTLYGILRVDSRNGASMRLRTLDRIALVDHGTEVPLDEPRLAALVVVLAIAGDAGMTSDDLLLLLTPGEKPDTARIELARLIAVARLRLGGESSIAQTGDRYALAPGLVSLDVDVHETEGSNDCAAFMAGFKLPGSPEFQDWIAHTRRRVQPIAVRRTPSKTRRLVTVAGLAAIILVTIGGYFAAHRADHRIAVGEAMLLADVKNETGDSVFDTGFATAAAISLQQSGRLTLYPRTRLRQVYRVMSIANPDTALTFELAKNVAQRDAVRFVLGLQVDRVGNGYRVTGRLADVSSSNQPRITTIDAPSRDQVLRALDGVLIQVRRQLGEANDDLRDRQQSLPFVTTPSLEALRSYGDGSFAWSRGEFRLAHELFQRAADLDTGFAMAYGALGMASYYFHDRVSGDRYYGEALKRSTRLTERERLRLMESWHDSRGATDSATVYAGLLAKRYPSVPTWYNYGSDLMKAGRNAEASAALHTALSFDSTHTWSYINLATLAGRQDMLDTAVTYYLQAGRTDPKVLYDGNINHEFGGTLAKLGRYAEAESAFTRMSLSDNVDNRARGFRSLGYLALWRGRVDEAITHYQRAVDATVQSKSTLSELRNRLLLSTAYRTAGRGAEASEEVRRSLASVDAVTVEPVMLALVATNAFAVGRTRDLPVVQRALRAKVKADNRGDVAAASYVSGLIALSAGHADSALAYARGAARLAFAIPPLALKAEAFRALGQLDSARVAVEAIAAAPGFGSEGQDDWLRAPILLGDLLLARGDTTGAATQYQRFLNQWRGARADLADMATARSRLASLGGAARR